MDQQQFERLTRAVANQSNRRGVAVVLGAAVAAGLGLSLDKNGADAMSFCRIPGSPCGRGRQCCSHTCNEGVCGCRARGQSCFQIGVSCCSGRCRRGKCA